MSAVKVKILDIQGFMLNRKHFIPKELAIYDGNQLSHYIFKPPFKYHGLTDDNKRQICWLESYFHGLRWSHGWVEFTLFRDILLHETRNDTIVYVKGYEKTKFIQRFLGYKAVEYPGDSPQLCKVSQSPTCTQHLTTGATKHCALTNVLLLWSKLSESCTQAQGEITDGVKQ